MKISDSEMEIMRLIWKKNEAVSAAQLLEELDTDWKQTTVLTFLRRLVDKGVLSLRKEGKTNYYTPLISEDEYKTRQTRGFLKEVHSGSVSNFLTALYGGKKPNKAEMDELKKWFEEEV
ncbi:MAG: BlaI/MecI/CopY family transcriptional regulator [Monoglobales bacterium]